MTRQRKKRDMFVEITNHDIYNKLLDIEKVVAQNKLNSKIALSVAGTALTVGLMALGLIFKF